MGMDVRLLTLSKRTLPVKKTIDNIITGLTPNSSDSKTFFAFKDYHMVQVTPVSVPEHRTAFDNIWSAAYNTRKKIREAPCDGMRILQSIILAGEQQNQDFWMSQITTLHVSMIHISNAVALDEMLLEKIEEAISLTAANAEIAEGNLVFYYTVDFCDIVIFTKNTTPKKHNDFLWALMTNPLTKYPFDSNLFIDAITIFAFEFDYAVSLIGSASAMRSVTDTTTLPPSDKAIESFDIHIRLNLQSEYPLQHLIEKLRSADVRIDDDSCHYIMGRYDIDLPLFNMASTTLFYAILLIEHDLFPTENSGKLSYGNYEISFISHKVLDASVKSQNTDNWQSQYVEIGESVNAITDRLREKICSTQNSGNQGIQEVYSRITTISQSLLSTLEHGFAEEFGLSVLPGFIAYLRLTEYNLCKLLSNTSSGIAGENDNDKRGTLGESTYSWFWTFQKKFLTAISSLSHCTMHSDKQFIQAPAFQMRLFEVQPKLLFLYSKLIRDIARYLQAEDGESFPEYSYEFLVVPDIRPDVYMDPISGADLQYLKVNTKLMLVYMPESVFYDPVAAAAILCHEVAHHVGNTCRFRNERLSQFFTAVSGYILVKGMGTKYKNDNYARQYGILVSWISEAMSEFFVEQFSHKRTKSPRQFYRETIFDFLGDTDYLINWIDAANFPEMIVLLLKKKLENNELNSALLDIAGKIEADYLPPTCFLSAPYNQEEIVFDAKIRTLIFLLKEIFGSFSKCYHRDNSAAAESYKSFCDSVLNGFSEAYADLKMCQLFDLPYDGKGPNISYSSLLDRFRHQVNGDNSFETMLRRDALRRLLTDNDNPDKVPGQNRYPDETANMAERRIYQYLSHCRANCKNIARNSVENPIPKFLETVLCGDAPLIFSRIQHEMVDFREILSNEVPILLKKVAKIQQTEVDFSLNQW